jgi:ADP-heptose:LPS heptosyltransferase
MPQSGGDVLMINSLMKNLKKLYPKKKIYVFTDPKFFDFINDNPNVYKLLPYDSKIESHYFLEGARNHKGFFDMAFFPNVMTQKTHTYIHNAKDKNQFKLR